MNVNWLRRKPSPETKAVEVVTQHVEVAAERSRWAAARLLQKLGELPLEDSLSGINTALRGDDGKP